MANPFRYFNRWPEVIRAAVLLYVKYPLSLRNVEYLLAERGIEISHETVRQWWNRFGPMFASEIKKKRSNARNGMPQWRWHLDEVFVTKRRNRRAALDLLKTLMRKYGRPLTIVTNKLLSYGAAMKVVGNANRHACDGHRINYRAENLHQPFRRRERAMHRFRRMSTLQKFTSVHASFHNHFNHERHLIDRATYKLRRSAAMAEWRMFAG